MNVYIYCGELYCEACGNVMRDALKRIGRAPANPDDETSYDSDFYPKGPYADAGGESDVVHHCGSDHKCREPVEIGGSRYGKFLENALTTAGVAELERMLAEDLASQAGPVLQFWADYYRKAGYDIRQYEKGKQEER